jgi:hypothetical protein
VYRVDHCPNLQNDGEALATVAAVSFALRTIDSAVQRQGTAVKKMRPTREFSPRAGMTAPRSARRGPIHLLRYDIPNDFQGSTSSIGRSAQRIGIVVFFDHRWGIEVFLTDRLDVRAPLG